VVGLGFVAGGDAGVSWESNDLEWNREEKIFNHEKHQNHERNRNTLYHAKREGRKEFNIKFDGISGIYRMGVGHDVKKQKWFIIRCNDRELI